VYWNDFSPEEKRKDRVIGLLTRLLRILYGLKEKEATKMAVSIYNNRIISPKYDPSRPDLLHKKYPIYKLPDGTYISEDEIVPMINETKSARRRKK